MPRSAIRSLLTVSCLFIAVTSIACSDNTADISRYAPMGEEKVFFEAEGQGKPVLVFIHGWSCDLTFWQEQMDYFKDKYRVLALDLPGHGQSTQPEVDYTLDYFAEGVKDVLDDAGVKKAFLVGHSMGYPVARQFIKNYPDRAEGMCIVDGAFFRIPDDPIDVKRWTQDMREFTKRFEAEDRDKFLVQFIDSLFGINTPEKLQEKIRDKMMSTPAHVGNSAMKEMVKAENWDEFSIDLPVLIVYAESIHLPEDHQEYLAAQFPDMEYHEMEDVGHFIMMEKVEEFNLILENYLQNRFPQKK